MADFNLPLFGTELASTPRVKSIKSWQPGGPSYPVLEYDENDPNDPNSPANYGLPNPIEAYNTALAPEAKAIIETVPVVPMAARAALSSMGLAESPSEAYGLNNKKAPESPKTPDTSGRSYISELLNAFKKPEQGAFASQASPEQMRNIAEVTTPEEPQIELKPKAAAQPGVKVVDAQDTLPPQDLSKLRDGKLPEEKTEDELTSVQNERSRLEAAVAFLRGINQVSAGIAQAKPQEEYLKDIAALSGSKVRDIKERQEQLKNKLATTKDKLAVEREQASQDPNDPKSVSARTNLREVASQVGVNLSVPDNLSYADIEKLFPQYTNIINAKMAQQTRLDAMKLASEAKAGTQAEKAEQKKLQDETKQAEIIRNIDDKTKYSQRFYNIQALRDLLAQDPNGVVDISLIYEYIKAMDPQSAVREGEIDLALSTVPWFKGIANLPKRLTRGDKLPASTRQHIMQNLERFQGSLKEQFKSHIKPVMSRVSQYNLNPDNVMLGLPGFSGSDISSNSNESPFNPKQESGINAFMKANNISNREQAVKILKQAGKL